MSDIPRYSANPLWFPWSFVDNPLGKFCEYRDYVKLQAENGRLRHEQKMKAIPVEEQLLDRLKELKAENELLRKAGDNAIKHSGTFNVSNDTEREQYQKWIMVIREWDTAKGVKS